MRLSWNEIRARAADFAREWADTAYEKGETQSFYNEFFEIFGKRRRDACSPRCIPPSEPASSGPHTPFADRTGPRSSAS